MDIRQFTKRKSISDSQNVENISNKRLRIEVPTSTHYCDKKCKAVCERPFALHRQQREKDKQNFDAVNLKKFLRTPIVTPVIYGGFAQIRKDPELTGKMQI